ncbi:uncharacterized protein OCT59_014494 [Rhizophagus irregularis]|uniref:uncharacterized protein n=1 Tax=Rhizophagus irregularis TaxID=588596 RepID=UPI0019F03821|nr:hypothetical protein OCT59_014494 [Rhizophagus irregularis]GBC44441.2 hypothetical protein GLOIN_2v1682931 [Rhizophagus irregularis DAOM 181602=DAOM 197198]
MVTWDRNNPYIWLNNLKEPWQRRLIREFVEPFRTYGIITPFNERGRRVPLTDFRPILIFTIWDAWSILWTYAYPPSGKMKLKTQIDYLMRSLECLAESLITIQPNQNLRPSTVNITYSRETQKGIAVKYMMGASVRCRVPMNCKTRFGELFRIGTLGNNAWTTDGTPSETCRFIHAHSFPTQESSTIEDKGTVSQVPACAVQNGKTLRYNNNSILVDAFGKSGRSRIGAFIGFKILKDSDPKELTSYITSVSEFGFNHIIIIGEIYSGIVFLDCYGRVFVWEDEGQMVFPLGGSPEEASKRSIGGDKLGWFVENGNVYMYIKKPQPCFFQFDTIRGT